MEEQNKDISENEAPPIIEKKKKGLLNRLRFLKKQGNYGLMKPK